MPLTPEDPRLTAWLLGELSDRDARDVKHAVAVDPALQLAVREIEAVQRSLSDVLSSGRVSLFPRQRNAILLEARRMDVVRSASAVGFPKRRVSWFFPVAAAAVLALACWLLVLLPGQQGDPPSDLAKHPVSPEQADGPEAWPSSLDAGPIQPSTQSNSVDLDFPVLIPRQRVTVSDQPVLPLPVRAGRHSLGWIRGSIRERKCLPSVHAVRLEEILNQFPLYPAGVASVAHGVALSSESVACPWSPDSQLLLIAWQAAKERDCDLSAFFHPNPGGVQTYRLLGYSRVAGAQAGHLPTRLDAGSVHSLLIELQPREGMESFGKILWKVNGKDAPTLVLPAGRLAPPSRDARFAALVASYSQWLSGQTDALDGRILARMAEDLRVGPLPTEREDFLLLVDETAELSGR